MGIYDFTLYDLINRNAVCYQKDFAWHEVDEDKNYTFQDYKNMVDKLAAALSQNNINKGDRIAVLGKNSYEYFLIYGAAAALGAIVLPINWRLSDEEILFNLQDCEPVIFFVDQEYQQNISGLKDKLPFVKHYYNLKSNKGNYQQFQALLNAKIALKPAEVSTNDDFVIIHTAAVAGRPRGAVLSHANVLFANTHFNYYLNVRPQDVHLNLLPLYHVGGLFMATNCFHIGALNVNMSKFAAQKAVELINKKQISLMFDFAPILSSIIEEHKKSGLPINSLKTVIGLDSPENIEEYQTVTGGNFFCLYGQTETSCLATIGKYNDQPGSAGKMIQMADLKIVDDDDNPVQIGEVGEIAVKGPMVFKGYWNLAEDTAYTFRNGWHHTGDLGRFDENAYLWYSGRKPEKELMKPGGENVYPAEVEKAILEHPKVDKTVVFGVPDPKWQEGIKAVCLLKKAETLETQELIAFVGKRIASYKKPHYIDFINDFPCQQDGSPDRAKIKELYG